VGPRLSTGRTGCTRIKAAGAVHAKPRGRRTGASGKRRRRDEGMCELEECNAVLPMTRPNRRFCSGYHRKVAEDRRRYQHQRETMSWIDLEKRQLRKSALRRKRRVEQLKARLDSTL
jgi:hypothetical protein